MKAEHELGELGRFGVGLPRVSDGQLLFQLNGISKLKETGRMAIIHNGSALFSGNPGGGESLIRQYVIENDWLEGIIQLLTTYSTIQEFQHIFGLLLKISLQNVKEKYNSLMHLICMKNVVRILVKTRRYFGRMS